MLEDEPTAEELDDHIWARLPGEDMPELREAVLKHMVHGPCGVANPSSPCMDPATRTCTKDYPKPASDHTYTDDRGFTVYRCPCETSATIRKQGRTMTVTDRNIPPYNRHLTLKFDCHINIEHASGAMTVKYIYKVRPSLSNNFAINEVRVVVVFDQGGDGQDEGARSGGGCGGG